MEREEKYLARIMFKSQVLQKTGNDYQALFWNVMALRYKDFQKVKPYGQSGDKKNDGFIASIGTYYQVYAPEELIIKDSEAIKKLNEDFAGLISFWDTHNQVRNFFFVLNDKYKGVSPNLTVALQNLRDTYSNVNFGFFLAKELEDEFMLLSDDDLVSIVGLIPSPEKIENLDYSILTEVVNHIIENQTTVSPSDDLTSIDFAEKIKFNNLNPTIAALLTVSNFQSGLLDDFFEMNSNYTKKELQKNFITYYENAKEEFKGTQSINDSVFADILEKASSGLIAKNKEKAACIQNATLILMSYYFEACDIFEKTTKDVMSAST